VMARWGGKGYGCSQWGDNGYENSRHLCLNLFAYNAETLWTGQPATNDFEKRFQSVFYGRVLPPLRKVVENAASRRAISPFLAWRLFRYRQQALMRLVIKEPQIARKATARRAVAKSRCQAPREKWHFAHFDVALQREIDVRERILLAARLVRGLSRPALRQAIRLALGRLQKTKAAYTRLWLKHNKRPNIEVSLAVYDDVATSLRQVLAQPAKPHPRFTCLDLGKFWNACDPSVGGIPFGMAKINGIPFAFADVKHTHVVIEPGQRIALSFPRQRLHDLHILCAGQNIPANADCREPLVEIGLLHGGKAVFSEPLLAVRHIVDWWAPRGEHMWAGGGLRHADPQRVRFGMSPGHFYGILHLNGFAVRGLEADALEFRGLRADKARMVLFALTLEGMRRR
ncbi:MAG: hypothetical protein N3A66_05935, partial [Planctomycetota bacterium]|nr:hypothetical protein [Planctomycetota bacterium]